MDFGSEFVLYDSNNEVEEFNKEELELGLQEVTRRNAALKLANATEGFDDNAQQWYRNSLISHSYYVACWKY